MPGAFAGCPSISGNASAVKIAPSNATMPSGSTAVSVVQMCHFGAIVKVIAIGRSPPGATSCVDATAVTPTLSRESPNCASTGTARSIANIHAKQNEVKLSADWGARGKTAQSSVLLSKRSDVMRSLARAVVGSPSMVGAHPTARRRFGCLPSPRCILKNSR